ncbi:MAG: hypothetical protein LBB26_01070 [Puniceicoccales bacterium]|jgi:hypothetical protein|nr:hypothetical protein [Puniceicoccales bacterium]
MEYGYARRRDGADTAMPTAFSQGEDKDAAIKVSSCATALAARTDGRGHLEPEIEAVRWEFLRFCPEREELICALVEKYVAAGWSASNIRRAVGEEVDRMMPGVIRERQARVTDIWNPETRAGVSLTIDFEEQLRGELDAADAVAETANQSKERSEKAKVEADASRRRALEEKAKRDRAKAAAGRAVAPPEEYQASQAVEGEKKKPSMFAPLGRLAFLFG